jgi:hypothetical protein
MGAGTLQEVTDADADSRATLVKTRESMMAKSEEWLKWVQEHYKK